MAPLASVRTTAPRAIGRPARRGGLALALLVLPAFGCGPKGGPPATKTVATAAFPAGEAFRARQPEPGAIRDFKAPAIQTFALPNGIDVFLVERHELPTVSIDLTFPGGSIDDPAGKDGLATLCMGLMSEGTRRLEKVPFEEAQADLASRISSSAGVDQQHVSMSSLTRNFEPTLDLWVDTLLTPGMRKADFDRNVKLRLESLNQVRASAEGVAGRVAGGIAFGERHPYGRIHTEASTKAIALDDCKTHVKTYVQPKGAQLWVVGDLTRQEVVDRIGKRLASWKGAPKRSAPIPPPSPRAGKLFFVDVAGAPQSVVRVMHHGPARNAADYHATYLMSLILGGDFSSRINMNLREAKGYAYGAYGTFGYNRIGSLFSARSSVRADVTKESIHELLVEIRKMKEGPVADEELIRAREGTILSLPGDWETGGEVLGTFRSLHYYGLPLNWYDGFVPAIQAITKDHVVAAAKSHLKPDEVRVLVVGDAKTVLPKVKELLAEGELGAGEVVMLDADGRVVPGFVPPR